MIVKLQGTRRWKAVATWSSEVSVELLFEPMQKKVISQSEWLAQFPLSSKPLHLAWGWGKDRTEIFEVDPWKACVVHISPYPRGMSQFWGLGQKPKLPSCPAQCFTIIVLLDGFLSRSMLIRLSVWYRQLNPELQWTIKWKINTCFTTADTSIWRQCWDLADFTS